MCFGNDVGQGVISEVGGQTVAVGNLRLLINEGINCHTIDMSSMNDEASKEGDILDAPRAVACLSFG